MAHDPSRREILTDYILSHQEEFYRLAYSYVKNRDTALDVVQESIVRALSRADSLRDPAYVKTWFYRILVNESINHFRRSSRLVPLELVSQEEPGEVRDDAARLDLYDAIERLKESTQLIVISHQRRTMEQADVLYGVSMQADGVSRVVSQRLDRQTGKVVDA